ncbi:MAG: polymer-forming cytoskeletal protein [Bacteroidia bacterium]|nr:polymer-forming cytoskeletal protein [Bacteroidia bacterium]
MFNKQNNKDGIPAPKGAESNSTSINLIGAGTVIEGDIKSNGDIRIDGTVHGHVISKAKVVVGSTGTVEGDINSQNADISGSVKGKTTINDLLFLKATSKMAGDIVTGKLIVEVGATFTGSCNMGPMIKDIKYADKSAESTKEKTA